MDIAPEFEGFWASLTGFNLDRGTLYILYDGDCILCQNAAYYYQIKASVGQLRLIDLRTQSELSGHLKSNNLDPNEGVLVLHEGRIYFGACAMSYLSRIGAPKITGGLFFSKILGIHAFSELMYPLMKKLRQLINWARGVGPL